MSFNWKETITSRIRDKQLAAREEEERAKRAGEEEIDNNI